MCGPFIRFELVLRENYSVNFVEFSFVHKSERSSNVTKSNLSYENENAARSILVCRVLVPTSSFLTVMYNHVLFLVNLRS